ncbi:MAG: hypothetical protein ACRYG2_19000 [Janthinobacterium lividum]
MPEPHGGHSGAQHPRRSRTDHDLVSGTRHLRHEHAVREHAPHEHAVRQHPLRAPGADADP